MTNTATNDQLWTYPLRFRFHLGAVPFSASVDKTNAGDVRVTMQGDVDVLPYSAEAPTRRAALLKALADQTAPARWFLTTDQRIALRTEFSLAGSPSLNRFVAEAVATALRRSPLHTLVAAPG